MICYIGIMGCDVNGEWYLYCEIFGGGLGGCYYVDGLDMIYIVLDLKNLLVEFVEVCYLVWVEYLGLCVDFGGLGEFCGGLGYCKDICVFEDVMFMLVVDCLIFVCWGVKGGKVGLLFCVMIDFGGLVECVFVGLCDYELIVVGEFVCIEMIGGGGWGDLFDCDFECVVVDVL